jgi:hypothetical protein
LVCHFFFVFIFFGKDSDFFENNLSFYKKKENGQTNCFFSSLFGCHKTTNSGNSKNLKCIGSEKVAKDPSAWMGIRIDLADATLEDVRPAHFKEIGNLLILSTRDIAQTE